jgi:hypothetical protein
MVMDNDILKKVSNVRRKIIEKDYNWGLYVYKKSNGNWFTDGEGNVLNIESMRGDISQISQLKKVAMHYGDDGEGTCVFVPGLTRITEEEHSDNDGVKCCVSMCLHLCLSSQLVFFCNYCFTCVSDAFDETNSFGVTLLVFSQLWPSTRRFSVCECSPHPH